MLSYNESIEVLAAFYKNCKQFWLSVGKDAMEANKLALRDVEHITKDPFSPNGDAIDPLAKGEILDQKRVCEKCGKAMTSGFLVYDGAIYYCSEACMFQDITEEEYEMLYEQDLAYWTNWEE
jgi:hypothetical protein